MNAPIQFLHNLCKTSFRRWKPEESLNEIKECLNKITARDVGFDPVMYHQNEMNKRGKAPVSYIELFQDKHSHTMAIFVVKRGGSLPLHDHPGMYGLLKVIYGQIKLTSYSEIESRPLPQHMPHPPKGAIVKTVTKNPELVVSASSDCCTLTPDEGNFHEVHPLTEFAAFLDILVPPYSSKGCHYFQEIQESSRHSNNISWLMEIPEPSHFYCEVFPYMGPDLNY